MYADGVRTFIEIGASANLTGFIDSILRGKDALAVALNSRRRSSLLQLLHGLGRLWSAGVELDVQKLYDGRPIVPALLTGEQPKRRRGRVYPNGLPYVKIPPPTIAEIRAALSPPQPTTPARDDAAATQSYPFLDRRGIARRRRTVRRMRSGASPPSVSSPALPVRERSF